MNPIDIAFGVLAGVVSCLTPEALLLIPLTLGAAGAADRGSVIAIATGLGLSLVLTGFLAGSLSFAFGADALWFRRIVCGLLVLEAIALMSAGMVERYPRLTGGHAGAFDEPGGKSAGARFRMLLLALFVGANWIPQIGPTLGRASLMAADIWHSHLALGVLFTFGLGAAVPWIVLGRVIRFVVRPFASGLLQGMAARRLLAVSLLAVAIVGSTGLDNTLAHWFDATLPAWTGKLAVTF